MDLEVSSGLSVVMSLKNVKVCQNGVTELSLYFVGSRPSSRGGGGGGGGARGRHRNGLLRTIKSQMGGVNGGGLCVNGGHTTGLSYFAF